MRDEENGLRSKAPKQRPRGLISLVLSFVSGVFSILGLLAPVGVLAFVLKHINDIQFDYSGLFAGIYLLIFITGIFLIPLAYSIYFVKKSSKMTENKFADLRSWSGQYLTLLIRRSVVGFVIVIASSVAYVEISEDNSGFIAIPIYSAIVFPYLSIVIFRVRRHYFGLNSTEAEELIEFLYSKREDGKGGRPSRIYAPAIFKTGVDVRARGEVSTKPVKFKVIS